MPFSQCVCFGQRTHSQKQSSIRMLDPFSLHSHMAVAALSIFMNLSLPQSAVIVTGNAARGGKRSSAKNERRRRKELTFSPHCCQEKGKGWLTVTGQRQQQQRGGSLLTSFKSNVQLKFFFLHSWGQLRLYMWHISTTVCLLWHVCRKVINSIGHESEPGRNCREKRGSRKKAAAFTTN